MKNDYNDKKRVNLLEQFGIKQGTNELILFSLIFLSIKFWSIRMTIKNDRTGELYKWGKNQKTK